MHTPGLKVAVPSNPYDAKGLLKTAIRDDNPVLFFEHKYLYGAKPVGGKRKTPYDDLKTALSEIPPEEYTIPFGQADVKRKGKDITIIATLLMVHEALLAAEELSQQGIEVEVVDPRTLVPLDKRTIFKSVEKTGRALIVSEDCLTAGVAAELAALVAEEAFDFLDAPVKRICVSDVPVPFAPIAQKFVTPDRNKIIKAVKEMCS
jgi:pyruvate/2-oxoglutarate/acetoin dehydrogenase E1 component